MKENRIFQQKRRNFSVVLVSILLAIFAMIISVKYQYPDNSSCQGYLGAGFPVLYICDGNGGGSPIQSWGKITPIDVVNGGIRPIGFVVDFLFYTIIFYAAILLILGIYQRVVRTRLQV
ncbi:MAG: hypothetical protein A2X25_07150 [Chloroflexi bacterium GWB2_49_20]|nr:MAG: hypothetical protein A2X25_07150 [Chloroflexi bacterium GWB2_49_20]OGN77936.1 MAG: hypothetical protein A2X26_14955 [Chloroflexi bacterium GWC2_49_37]OGN84974.1 MAG: hypothetical protein A2X27_09655 [Chloroflexi bacterium GWD2_49_16]HBG74997.1 hypothetical protein [Anaerolineae bacterium]HCC79746.1 hypothetical protein [Anaerolineae bacterium]